MPSTPSLYRDAAARQSCYTCIKTAPVQVKNKSMQLECRRYTQIGLTYESDMAAKSTELADKRLIDVIPIGVDTAKFSNEKHLQYKVQSRGGGGLSKYECGSDYQTPQLIGHEKLAFTERLYIHDKFCAQTLISTELQDLAFPNDRYSDKDVTPSMFTDAMVSAARRAISEGINQNDIVGVFGGADENADSYDGVLAQAYWAYSLNAYFHSVEFIVDVAVLVSGTFLHAKYAGLMLDLEFDSSQASDSDIERYQTLPELYSRLVQWLNEEVLTAGGRKYVDATFYQNTIIVTHQWTAQEVILMLTIDENASINWADCGTNVGVSFNILQGVMPVDERPFLVEYRPYTTDTILRNMVLDIYNAKKDMNDVVLDRGQVWALYVDSKLLDMYNVAAALRSQNEPAASLASMFTESNGTVNIYSLNALSKFSGTGLWFITAIEETGNSPRLRNIKHVVDSTRGTMPFIGTVDDSCEEIKMKYDQLHGVFVWNFTKFASNLLCSPFVANLDTPHANTLPALPCFNAAVRSTEMDYQPTAGCAINACFRVGTAYINSARYALPSLLPNTEYDFFILEDGQTLPSGAISIYEIPVTDCTTGIAIDDIPNATYSYSITFSDGQTVAVLTGKDPIISFVGNIGNVAFNITQTVTSGTCTATFDGSRAYDSSYPFQMLGACADVDLAITGRIDLTAYTVTSATDFNTAATVTGAPTATIDLSANPSGADAEEAAAIINAYFLANNIAGYAVGVGSVLVVQSPNVEFVSLDAAGTPTAFTKEYRLSMFDNTDYDANDGLGSIEVRVYCQTQASPVNPTFTALPSLEDINACSAFAGWEVDIIVTTVLGCTFELSATVNSASAAYPANQVSFTFA